MNPSKTYQEAYLGLPEQLAQKYPHLNFQNHCYLRMALDHVVGDQWDTQIKRPAYTYLKKEQLQKVVQVLQSYLENEPLIHQHHKASMAYRNAWSKKQGRLDV